MSSSRPTGSSHPSLFMGGVSLLGGVIGFMKSSSKASLIGGTAAAASFGLSAYLINKNNDLGYDVGYLTSMGLIAKFGPSQFDKPSLRGGIAVAAVVVGVYNGLKSFEAKGIM